MAENKKKITPAKVLYEDKPSHFLAYLLVLVIVAALFGGAYFSWKNYFQAKFPTTDQGITITVPSPPPIDIKLPDQEVTIELDTIMKVKSAESVVEDFYDWYLGYSGSPMIDKSYKTHPAITAILAEKVEKLANSSLVDPFLCAESRPGSFTVSPAQFMGSNAATVMVNENFNGSTVQVKINLRLSNNAWQMTNLQCVPQDSLTAFLDLLRDETGIPFSAPQPLAFSWSIPDDKGSETISIQGKGIRVSGVVIHPDALQTFFRVQGFDMDPLSLDTGKDGYQKGNMVCVVEDYSDKSGKHDVTVNCGML